MVLAKSQAKYKTAASGQDGICVNADQCPLLGNVLVPLMEGDREPDILCIQKKCSAASYFQNHAYLMMFDLSVVNF